MSDRLAAVLALAGLLLVATAASPRPSPGLVPRARARRSVVLQVDPAVRERHESFHRTVRPWTYTALVLGLAVPLAYGLTPLGAWLAGAVGTGPVPLRAALGGLVLGVVAEVVTLPLALRRELVLRRYGLSVRSWGSWLGDAAKSALIGAALSGGALAALYALLGSSPTWWWVIAAPGAAVLVAVLSFVFPVLVEPLFAKFAPMPDSPLRQRLHDLAERAGVPVRDVLVADASRRTTALNAYVSGFGPTRRIVVYDTLLRDAPAGEVEVVVAHELGHAARHDVVRGTVLSALGVAALCCVLHLALSSPSLLRAAGVESGVDPRSVGLLFAVAATVGLAASPVQNMLSRRVESRADTFALELGGRPGVFAAMQRRLALVNLADLDPGLVPYLLFASHPTTVQRIAAAHAFAADAPVPAPDRTREPGEATA